MRIVFTDKEQLDLVEAQALADSAEDNTFALVKALLFSGDYRIEGGAVNPDSPVSGVTKIDPGIFVKADGKFYTMATTATANILTGVENQPANIWGTGQAAHATLPRKDIICVTFQQLVGGAAVKTFIDDTVSPPVQYTQTVSTRKTPAPLFVVLHGTPSATPSEPAVPSGYMKLATIYVGATVTVINSGDITNNLNINLKTLEKIQLASQASSAFSDLLHGHGVYQGVSGEMAVSETSPQSMGVQVGTGVALKAGITANVNTATTVPISAASFVNKPAEVVSFAALDTQVLQCDGNPPHQIRAATYLVTGIGGTPTYTDTSDYTIDLVNGTITRLSGGLIPSGGSVEVTYDYYLPRIDVIEILMANSTPQAIDGTPSSTPVAPTPSPNALLLAYVYVGEGVIIIVDANVTDKRVYLSTTDEVIAARSSPESGDNLDLPTRLNAHENRGITVSQAVHGVRQGTGNGFDADMVDGTHVSSVIAPNVILPLDGTGKFLVSAIPQGPGSTLNADTVDGFNATSIPTANTLLPLNGSAKVPPAAIAQGVGSGLDADTLGGDVPSNRGGQIALLSDVASQAVPAGTMVMWPAETVPTGWYEADGRSRLRTAPDFDGDYSNVYTNWGGPVWGYADASHFYSPDMRGVVPRGWNHGATSPTPQTFIAIAGQKIFTLTGGVTYHPGTGGLMVTVNGVVQPLTAYAETDSTKITFVTAPGAGKTVILTVFGFCDPNASTRTSKVDGDNGSTGDHAGSYQMDAEQGHIHANKAFASSGGGSLVPGTNTTDIAIGDPTADSHGNGNPRTAIETRMKNAYVMFIIKL